MKTRAFIANEVNMKGDDNVATYDNVIIQYPPKIDIDNTKTFIFICSMICTSVTCVLSARLSTSLSVYEPSPNYISLKRVR